MFGWPAVIWIFWHELTDSLNALLCLEALILNGFLTPSTQHLACYDPFTRLLIHDSITWERMNQRTESARIDRPITRPTPHGVLDWLKRAAFQLLVLMWLPHQGYLGLPLHVPEHVLLVGIGIELFLLEVTFALLAASFLLLLLLALACRKRDSRSSLPWLPDHNSEVLLVNALESLMLLWLVRLILLNIRIRLSNCFVSGANIWRGGWVPRELTCQLLWLVATLQSLQMQLILDSLDQLLLKLFEELLLVFRSHFLI